MSDPDIKKFIKMLPDLIKNNDEVRGAIIGALSGVVATKGDIKVLTKEMDKRFEALTKEMDKRFEAMTEEMNRRFERVDKRFEAVDKRFDGIEGILLEIKSNFGRPFEQFARNVVIRILDGEGVEGVKLASKTIRDPGNQVFEDTTEFEIDGFSSSPPILVEITSILKNKLKVEKFLKKKEFIEKKYDMAFRGFFVAGSSELTREEKADITLMLKKHHSELINL